MIEASLLSSTLLQDDVIDRTIAATIQLGSPGRCGPLPTLTVVVTDESPSVSGGGGNDPVGRRHSEMRAALEQMTGSCTCGRCRVAVVTFDTPRGDLRQIKMRSPLYRAIVRGYFGRLWLPGMSSELAPALRRATALKGSYPHHLTQIAILTDWELHDHIDDIERLVAQFDHVLAIGLNSPVPEWLRQRGATALELSPTDQRGSLALAIFTELIRHRPGAIERSTR